MNHPVETGELQLFETLIEGLLASEYGVCDDFLDKSLVGRLRNNLFASLESGQMHPAGVGRKFDFQKNALIRGDVIRWIEPETSDNSELELFARVNRFVQYLNASCYTGINDFEFHYACYERNSFYKRHLDQFKSHKGRKFSLVVYLNDNWKESDGGKLTLFLPGDREEVIYPAGGRAVFFKSDEIEHEVSPSPNRQRISIAGWLKST